MCLDKRGHHTTQTIGLQYIGNVTISSPGLEQSSVVISGNYAYVGTREGKIIKVDVTANPPVIANQYDTKEPISAAPLIYNSILYIATQGGSIFALNTTDLTPLAGFNPTVTTSTGFNAPAIYLSDPTINVSEILFMDNLGKVFILDPLTGALINSLDMASDSYISSSPAIGSPSGQIAITTSSGKVYVINKECTIAEIYYMDAESSINPVFKDGINFFTADMQGKVYAYKTNDPSFISSQIGNGINTPLMYDYSNNSIFVSSANSYGTNTNLYQLNSSLAPVGTPIAGTNDSTAGGALTEKSLYSVSNDGSVNVINRDTNTVFSKYPIGANVNSSLAMSNVVVVNDNMGRMHVFNRMLLPTPTPIVCSSWNTLIQQAPFGNVTEHAAFVLNGSMFVAGGIINWNNNDYLKETFFSNDGQNWSMLASSVPFGDRQGLACTVLNNKVYLTGGFHTVINGSTNPKVGYSDVWSSLNGRDWVSETNSIFGDTQSGPAYHTCVTFNNALWLIGGMNYSTSGSGEARNSNIWTSIDGATWTQVANNPRFDARYGHGCVVFNNKIWVIGGMGTTKIENDVWYSSDGINWTKALENAPFLPRWQHTCVAFNNKIWVIGGFEINGTGSPITVANDAWSSSDGINWTQELCLGTIKNRAGHANIVYQAERNPERMYLIGGRQGIISNLLSDVQCSGDDNTVITPTVTSTVTRTMTPTLTITATVTATCTPSSTAASNIDIKVDCGFNQKYYNDTWLADQQYTTGNWGYVGNVNFISNLAAGQCSGYTNTSDYLPYLHYSTNQNPGESFEYRFDLWWPRLSRHIS
jgi:hypothetical protein